MTFLVGITVSQNGVPKQNGFHRLKTLVSSRPIGSGCLFGEIVLQVSNWNGKIQKGPYQPVAET